MAASMLVTSLRAKVKEIPIGLKLARIAAFSKTRTGRESLHSELLTGNEYLQRRVEAEEVQETEEAAVAGRCAERASTKGARAAAKDAAATKRESAEAAKAAAKAPAAKPPAPAQPPPKAAP